MVMNYKGVQVEQSHDVDYGTVADYMARDLVYFQPDQEIGDAIDIMLKKRVSGGPVLNEKRELVGVLSEKDCLKVLLQSSYHNIPSGKGKVKDYMSENVKTVDINTDIITVANDFLNSFFRRMPVTDNGIVRGQISRRDVMKATQKMNTRSW